MACNPDAQARETSRAAAVSGMPLFTPTTRAEKSESRSVGQVVVKTMWSTASGSAPERSMQARAT